MKVPKKVTRNSNTQSDSSTAPAILKAARIVFTALQRGAIAQVTAIAHTGLPAPAIVLKHSLGSIVTLEGPGVLVRPKRKPMGGLYWRTAQGSSPL